MINLWLGFTIVNIILLYLTKDEIEQAALLDPDMRRRFYEMGYSDNDILIRVHICMFLLAISGPTLWLFVLLNVFKH